MAVVVAICPNSRGWELPLVFAHLSTAQLFACARVSRLWSSVSNKAELLVPRISACTLALQNALCKPRPCPLPEEVCAQLTDPMVDALAILNMAQLGDCSGAAHIIDAVAQFLDTVDGGHKKNRIVNNSLRSFLKKAAAGGCVFRGLLSTLDPGNIPHYVTYNTRIHASSRYVPGHMGFIEDVEHPEELHQALSVLQQWVAAMNTETSRISARKRRPPNPCPRIRRHLTLLIAKFDRGESNTESDAVMDAVDTDVANFARKVLGESWL